MISYLIPLFLIPLIGYFVDKKGKRITLYFICTFLTILANSLLMYTSPLIPVILAGFGMSI